MALLLHEHLGGRCREIQGDIGRYREVYGEMLLLHEHLGQA